MLGSFVLEVVYSVITLYKRNTHNLSFYEFTLLAAAFILDFIYAGFVCFTYTLISLFHTYSSQLLSLLYKKYN